MFKKFISTICLFFFAIPVSAFEIAFPQENELTLSQDGIFFIGKVEKKETIWINDKKITPQKNGSFAESFKLSTGENVFFIGTEDNRQKSKYIITYELPQNDNAPFMAFMSKDYKTNCNNVILRSTPVDFGMNRLGYLPKGTDLEINGTQNEFSRVYLCPTKCAWVMSKHIIPEPRGISVIGEYRGETLKSDNNSTNICYKFSKNLPYSVIYRNSFLYIDVYNVENRPNQTFHSEIKLKPPYCYSSKMEDNELVIDIPKIKMDKKIKIVIDPGHGGRDPGAVGCLLDLEKDFNLKAAKALEKELKSEGFKTILTRKDDKYVSLNDRINLSKDKNAVIFISLHMNSVPENINPNTHKGSETYYYTDFSRSLATNIQSELTKTLGTKDNGVMQASFAVIRPTEYVGVLVETAYMVNPEDVELYKSKDFFKKVGVGITKGIEKYLKEL